MFNVQSKMQLKISLIAKQDADVSTISVQITLHYSKGALLYKHIKSASKRAFPMISKFNLKIILVTRLSWNIFCFKAWNRLLLPIASADMDSIHWIRYVDSNSESMYLHVARSMKIYKKINELTTAL